MIPEPAPSTDPAPTDAAAGLLPPASTTELTLTLIWRLVLTLISGAGLVLMFAPLRTLPQILNQVLYFTTVSTILVFLVALFGLLRPLFFLTFPARRKLEGNLGWLRGLSTCASLLTGLVFGFILSGNLSTPTSFIPHLALPVLSVIDWILVGRNQSLLPWWVPLTWTLSLVPYLFIYAWDALNDKPMYAFLNPARPSWWPWVGMLSAGFLLLAYVLWGAGRLRARVHIRGPRPAGHRPGPGMQGSRRP